jgi:formylglycine-generating enzyme required for sulfatase activity
MNTKSIYKTPAGEKGRAIPEVFINNHWVEIPGGQVTLEHRNARAAPTRFDVVAFAIARYPVTNVQYTVFVEAGGYSNRAWWTDNGWAAKEKNGWTEWRYCRDHDWNQPDCPVVGVSWHEAMAFCQWLSEVAGQAITLPTEQQWQRAAQGDDGREYPWGNEPPSEHLCNWNRNIDQTTPVAYYPAGASPYGVMDMSGNVWEWCLTGWDDGETEAPASSEARVLRGGSWSSDSPLSLRVANRNRNDPNTSKNPNSRDTLYGFRCVRF